MRNVGSRGTRADPGGRPTSMTSWPFVGKLSGIVRPGWALARVRQVFCVNGRIISSGLIPGRLNGPERRVGLCGDATRAPTQGPGFRECERDSPPGPGILAQKRKISGVWGQSPHPGMFFFRMFHGRDLRHFCFRNAVAEQNREALQRGLPVLHRHGPLFRDMFQG